MQRRHFLSAAASLPLAFSLARARAAAPRNDTPRFLLVFLRGAYDSNSLLVPTHSDFYYHARPTIAIARPGETGGALPLDGQWGLHPAMEGSLLPLVQAQQACLSPLPARMTCPAAILKRRIPSNWASLWMPARAFGPAL